MPNPLSDHQTIFEQMSDGVYFVDPDRRITYWNQSAVKITGYQPDQMTGQFCMSNLLMHVDDAGNQLCLNGCPLAATLADGQPRAQDVYLHHVDGHRVRVGVRVAPVIENGAVVGAVEVFKEKTTLASAQARIEQLQRAALLDELTGVANRRMANLRLETVAANWANHGVPFAVMMLDVDRFKQVNDTYGHATGDRVLRMIASSLSSGLRSYDFLARWGGEEFLAVLTNLDDEEPLETTLALVAERLRMLVEQSILFLDNDDRRVSRAVKVTISAGGAVVRPGETWAGLVARADENLYRSKMGGRNKVTL